MLLTPAILRAATGCTAEAAERFAPPLAAACDAYLINTPARLAAFLAQIGHESGSMSRVAESFDYGVDRLAAVFGSARAALAMPHARRPGKPADQPALAEAVYGGEWGEKNLGNTAPGDGWRYRGRGLIQTTGRSNYRALRDRLQRRGHPAPDFEADPAALEAPTWAAWSAADYWDRRGLSGLADAGDFEAITRRINGGLNGQADRVRRLQVAREALAAIDWTLPPSGQGILDDSPLVRPGPEPADYHTPAGEVPSWTPPQEQTMPILPGLIQAFGPGLIKGLASTLIEGFAPLAKEKLQKEMGRHTDNPAVADQIAENLVGAAMQLTGIDQPVQAVAAAQQRPEVQQQVQESALEHLNRMAPILDRLAALDAQQAKLVEDSREAAERRARETLQAGGEDQDGYLTRSVVRMMIGVMVGLGVLAAVLKAMDVDVDMILGTVMTLAGVVATSFRDRYGHRYGSSNGSAAKDAVIGELTRRR